MRSWLLCLMLIPRLALALDPAVPLGQLSHQSWGESQGAPRYVTAMAQTTDGWIWMSAYASLTRFDGVRFTTFVPSNGTRLLYTPTSFLPDEHGRLYIGYAWGGLSVVEGDRLEHLFDRKTVGTTYKMAFDSQGALWLATTTSLLRYAGGKLEKIGAEWGYPAKRAEYVHVDRYGRIWVSSGASLHLLAPGARQFRALRPLKTDAMIVDAPDGAVWLLQGPETTRLAPPDPGLPMRPLPASRHSTFQSVFDRDGNFWSHDCPRGLCRLSAHHLKDRHSFVLPVAESEILDQSWQLTSPRINSVLEDREGNIWVGTQLGVDRFRNQMVRMVPELTEQGQIMLAFDHEGVPWAASVDNERKGHLWKIINDHAIEQPNPHAHTVIAQSANALLLGGANVIERRGAQGSTLIPLPPKAEQFRQRRFLQRIMEDPDSLRIVLTSEGHFRWRDGAWQQLNQPSVGTPAYSMVDARGRILQGYRENRLQISEQGRVSNYGPEQGVDVEIVGFIQAEPDLVISGVGGLQLWKDGRFHTLRLEHTGASVPVSGIVVGKDGTRWINSVQGLLRVAPGDWRRTVESPSTPLRAHVIDAVYGYPGGAEMVRRENTAQQAADGRIWLTSSIGVGWLHPGQLQRNQVPPPVHILQMRAGGQQYRLNQAATLAAGTSELAFDYTALSYTVPERVQFRYRLHGQDNDWQQVGTRRAAFYTNLGPGTYRFEVVATNEDGVDGPAALSQPFTILPTFTQTVWFWLLVAAAGIALLALAYHLRVRQLAKRYAERANAQLQERERIARTLHDGFLQHVYGLQLQVQSAVMHLPDDAPARDILEQALEAGDKTLDEGRAQVRALRQELAEGADLLSALREAAAMQGAPAGLLTVEGSAPALPHQIASELFAITREAVCNALRHAGANSVVLRCDGDAQDVLLVVSDNGRGFVDSNQASPPGHFGLQGMRERAAQIRAELAIDSRPGIGTTVTLRWRRKKRLLRA